VGCLLLTASSALAGKITGFTTFGSEHGTGPGLGSVLIAGIVHLADNNDNQTGGGPDDNNITVQTKRFDNKGYIDIEFHVANTGGVSEYSIVEFIDNNILPIVDWTQFRMYLGFGVGGDFELSPSGDGLDFDFDSFDFPPSSDVFSQVALGEDQLVFFDGLHGSDAQEYTLRIDVPDGLTNGMFTLRQVPIVPEPSTLALSAVAVIAGCTALRRR
jgi:hypothetical protein